MYQNFHRTGYLCYDIPSKVIIRDVYTLYNMFYSSYIIREKQTSGLPDNWQDIMKLSFIN